MYILFAIFQSLSAAMVYCHSMRVAALALMLSTAACSAHQAARSKATPPTLAYEDARADYVAGLPIVENLPLPSANTAFAHYAVTPGLPLGLMLDAQSGIIRGVPRVASDWAGFTIVASLEAGGSAQAALDIRVRAGPPIVSFTEANGTAIVGVPYATTLGTNSGDAIASCRVADADELPWGLVLDPLTCAVSGTATVPWPRDVIRVLAQGMGGAQGTVSLSLAVVAHAGGVPPVYGPFTYSNLPLMLTAGVPVPAGYGLPVFAKHFAPQGCISSFAISTGLTLSPETCGISGTPTRAVDAFADVYPHGLDGDSVRIQITVAVQKVSGTYATSPAHYTVGEAIVPNILSSGVSQPAFHSLTQGLPYGLTIDTNGTLSGTPQAPAALTTYEIVVADDVHEVSATVAFDIVSLPPAFEIWNQPYAVHVGSDFDFRPGFGGASPSSCALAPGDQLPAGLRLSSSCEISGTPTAIVHAALTLTASNNFGATSSAAFTLDVVSRPPLLRFANSPLIVTPFAAVTVGLGTPNNVGGPISNCALAAGSLALPDGLAIDTQTCAVVGTPTTLSAAQTYALTVDYPGGALSLALVLGVSALQIFPPSVTLNSFRTETVSFLASAGTAPYTYALDNGLGAIDAVSGAYTLPQRGAAGFATVTATDAAGAVAAARIVVTSEPFDDPPSAIVADGNAIAAGGFFTAFAPYATHNIAALDALSATPRLAFDVQAGFNGKVAALLAVGHTLYVGGDFSTYRGLSAPYLVALDATSGALLQTFPWQSSKVAALIEDGGFIYVGAGGFGRFVTTTGGMMITRFARASGAVDPNFFFQEGVACSVGALARVGTLLYAAPGPQCYATSARLFALDSASGAFQASFAYTGQEPVNALATDGTTLFAGTHSGVSALSSTGDLGWSAAVGDTEALALVGGTLYAGAGSTVQALATQTGALIFSSVLTAPVASLALGASALYVGLQAGTMGVGANAVVKMDLDTGAQDPAFVKAIGFTYDPGSAEGPSVNALSVVDGTVIAAGMLVSYDGAPTPHVTKLDSFDMRDTAFAAGGTGPATHGVNQMVSDGTALYVQAYSHLTKVSLASGAADASFTVSFTGSGLLWPLAAGGGALVVLSGSAIEILDAATGATRGTLANAAGTVAAIASNTVYAGTYDGSLAAFDLTTGHVLAAFQAPLVGPVSALLVTDSALYVAGTLWHEGTRTSLLKLDRVSGVADQAFTASFAAGPYDTSISSLAYGGGALFLSGSLAEYAGQAVQGLVKLDAASGAVDAAFTQAAAFDGQVSAVTFLPRGLNVLGDFFHCGGKPALGMVTLDPTTGETLPL